MLYFQPNLSFFRSHGIHIVLKGYSDSTKHGCTDEPKVTFVYSTHRAHQSRYNPETLFTKQSEIISWEYIKSQNHEIELKGSLSKQYSDFSCISQRVKTCDDLPFMQTPLAISIFANSCFTASVSFPVRSWQFDVKYAASASNRNSGTHASEKSMWHVLVGHYWGMYPGTPSSASSEYSLFEYWTEHLWISSISTK